MGLCGMPRLQKEIEKALGYWMPDHSDAPVVLSSSEGELDAAKVAHRWNQLVWVVGHLARQQNLSEEQLRYMLRAEGLAP